MLLNKTYQLILSKFPLFNIGLIFSLGLVTTSPAPLLASNLEGLEKQQQTPTANSTSVVSLAQTIRSNSSLPNGTYLYGESSKPEQIGQEYLVFQVRQNRVIGAIYMPRSEFRCFYGTLDSRQMNLSIVDPDDKTVYPYSIALQKLSPVAVSVGLQGYQQIDTISDNDQRILGVCLDNHQ
ncbi:MAG: hypothetical protein AB4426_32085 [Xenococcaceae cyanobacterium]